MFEEWAITQGPFAIALALLLIFGYRGARSTYKLLFDPTEDSKGNPKGLAISWIKENIEATDRIIKIQEEISRAQAQSIIRDDKLIEQVCQLRKMRLEQQNDIQDIKNSIIQGAVFAEKIFQLNNEAFRLVVGRLAAIREMHKLVGSKRTILLAIEDSETDAVYMKQALGPIARKYNLTFENVESIAESQKVLDRAALIILDVGLPDSSSPELTNIFIRLCTGLSIPVIVYSGSDWESNDFQAANLVLKKSTDTTALVAAVDAILGRIQ